MNDCEEDKIWKANEETKRKEEVGGELPAILEEEETGEVSNRNVVGDFGQFWELWASGQPSRESGN